MLGTSILGSKDGAADVLIEAGANVNIRNYFGEVPIVTEIYLDKYDVANKLLEKGANVMSRDYYNNTPLHFAAFNNNVFLVEKFITKGADVKLIEGEREKSTLLHRAPKYGYTYSAKLLLQQGANVNARNINGRTPFFFSIDSIKL